MPVLRILPDVPTAKYSQVVCVIFAFSDIELWENNMVFVFEYVMHGQDLPSQGGSRDQEPGLGRGERGRRQVQRWGYQVLGSVEGTREGIRQI